MFFDGHFRENENIRLDRFWNLTFLYNLTTTSYRLKACNHRNKNISPVTSIDLWSIPHLGSSSTRLPMESCSWAAQPNELITNQKLADCWGRATFPRTKGANNQPLHELLEKRSYHPATNWEPETELRNSQAGVQPPFCCVVVFGEVISLWDMNFPARGQNLLQDTYLMVKSIPPH